MKFILFAQSYTANEMINLGLELESKVEIWPFCHYI